MTVTRHQFLAMLHELLKPRIYLEVGVQHGSSLELARGSELAIGIDPVPLRLPVVNEVIYPMTSNMFFNTVGSRVIPGGIIDMAFIDGSHLFEDAFEDFINISGYCDKKSVVVFDDVLPYNQDIAARQMPPGGDWTGDVWKMGPVIDLYTHLNWHLVDTWPTGTMVVWGYKGLDHPSPYMPVITGGEDILAHWIPVHVVPDDVINRTNAVQADAAIEHIRETL